MVSHIISTALEDLTLKPAGKVRILLHGVSMNSLDTSRIPLTCWVV